MKNLWKRISLLGLNKEESGLSQLSIILCNQINAIILIIMFMLLIVLRLMAILENEPEGISSFRILLLMTTSVLNLFFASKKKFKLAKISVITMPPLIFLLFPTFIGFVKEEYFVYYPFVLIAFSTIPLTLLHPDKEKTLSLIIMMLYFVLLIFIDKLLILFMPEDFIIVDLITKFYVFYKTSHIAIFVFINATVYYLRKLNVNYDHKINRKNILLTEHHKKLQNAFKNLKFTQEKLAQSEKMAALGTLTAGVAHEINNPLNFISCGVSIVKDLINDSINNNIDIDIEKLSENLNMVEIGISRTTHILESLLVFSYQGNSEKQEADVHKIIEGVITFLKSKLNNEIEIDKNFNLQNKILVYIDKLHQVLLNIMDNSIYVLTNCNVNSKKLTISTNSVYDNNQNIAQIIICNTGPAIPEHIYNKIFDPFFTTKEVGEGIGLGLTICYNIVKEHNGDITVENEDGNVRFIVSIPY